MTKILILKKNDLICGFQVKGHSGFAESGQDIVCSAISTACQMALVGLQEVLKLKVSSEIHDGFMLVELDKAMLQNESAQNILSAMEKTLESIAKDYVRFVKMEVKKDVY